MHRNAAATLLGISRAGVDKLAASGILPDTRLLPADAVRALANRSRLAVSSGELTVLRTAARDHAYDEDRDWIGFHVDHTDTELEETSLRWWRSDPNKILSNELYTVTVATAPAATYKITGVAGSMQRPGEQGMRYHYEGELLARLSRDDDAGTIVIDYRTVDPTLRHLTQTVMESRIFTSSGGPIGYLN